MDDELGRELEMRDVQLVFYRRRAQLAPIFHAYARSKGVMSLEVWQRVVKEGNLVDNTFTLREATSIFVRVNLDDELYAEEGTNVAQRERAAKDEAACDFGEFELMIGRLAREKILEASEPLASTIDSFLHLIFIPTYRKLLKPRGVVVPISEAHPSTEAKR